VRGALLVTSGIQEVQNSVNTGIQELGVPLDLGFLLQEGLELLLNIVKNKLAATGLSRSS